MKYKVVERKKLPYIDQRTVQNRKNRRQNLKNSRQVASETVKIRASSLPNGHLVFQNQKMAIYGSKMHFSGFLMK